MNQRRFTSCLALLLGVLRSVSSPLPRASKRMRDSPRSASELPRPACLGVFRGAAWDAPEPWWPKDATSARPCFRTPT